MNLSSADYWIQMPMQTSYSPPSGQLPLLEGCRPTTLQTKVRPMPSNGKRRFPWQKSRFPKTISKIVSTVKNEGGDWRRPEKQAFSGRLLQIDR